MTAELNRLIDAVEQDLAEDLDVAEFVARIGTTEYHVRRMFSSLAGMPATPSWEARTEIAAPTPSVLWEFRVGGRGRAVRLSFVRDSHALAVQVQRALETPVVGSLCVWGDWFGRPYDNLHRVVSARTDPDGSSVTFGFNEGETLQVWDPMGVDVAGGELLVEDATCVRWEWFFYGRPQTPENRFYIEHRKVADTFVVTSDVDWFDPDFTPSYTSPAVRIVTISASVPPRA